LLKAGGEVLGCTFSIVNLSSVTAFSEDDYQSCSGKDTPRAKRGVEPARDAAGAKAHAPFATFAARLKSCLVTKQQHIACFSG